MKQKRLLGKLLLTVLALCSLLTANAVKVTIVMNGTSRSMTLLPEGQAEVKDTVHVGAPTGTAAKQIYSFNTDAGNYVLTGYDSDSIPTGTLVLEVPVNAPEDSVAFSIVTISAWVTNMNEDKTIWKVDEDYTIPENEIYASSRAGDKRTLTVGKRTVSDNVQTTFNILVGDTYTVYYYPTEKRSEYLSNYKAATMTAQTGNANIALATAVNYTIKVPKEATLFVGSKTLTHYVPFKEVKPANKEEKGDTAIYTFRLPAGKNTYNYRVNMNGCMAHAGKFGYSDSYPKYELVIKKEDMLAHGDTDYFNHDVTSNQAGNVADIYLNINERGHLRLEPNADFQIVGQRVWQLIDDQSNNYFVEPDYHYTVLDTDFKPSQDVVEVDENGLLHAKAKGTAIIQVRYDALYAYDYNRVDAFGNFGKDIAFWFGAQWSCLWAENVGTFVVTVGETEDASMKPNFTINTELEERKDFTLDSELDILYYFEDQPGYYYTFAPENASKVEVANPKVDTIANTLEYPNGFSEDNVQKMEDGKYKLLLTYGRNIIRVTSNSGATAYQIVSAKPIGYEVKNASRPNDDKIYAGDSIDVQFHGLFHPALKLSGIYNQSAYIYYNNTPNGTSLILSPNQYSFAGNPAAQRYKVIVPATSTGESYDLLKGALYVKGYGSVAGKHRVIDRIAGINPNFTAPVTTEYWGYIPNVSIPLAQITDGVKFENLPEEVTISVLALRGDTILPDAEGIYYCGPRSYSYEAFAIGRKAARGQFTVTSGQGVVTIDGFMEEIAADDNTWDGKSIALPDTVTAAESEMADGDFANMQGYYKINNGYELAWLAYYINKSKDNSTTQAVLTRDIDLKGYEWTPVGQNNQTPYNGVFEGNRHSIKGLHIDNESSNVGIFGYSNSNVVIRNLSVYGSVKTTGDGAAAIIGNVQGNCTLENCHNFADVTGGKYVGGIMGNSYYYPKTGDPLWEINNCSNNGNITAQSYVGGIAGRLNIYNYYIIEGATASHLSNTGTITATIESGSAYAGGIAGRLDATNIVYAYNTGDVITYTTNEHPQSGGIAGYATSQKDNNMLLKNVYNTGVIKGAAIIDQVKVLTIENAYTIEGTYLEGDSIQQQPKDAFANGKVTWLLGGDYGQEINKDTVPVFNGSKVYLVSYTTSKSNETDTLYANSTLPATLNENAVIWRTAEGDDIVENITSDTILYAEYVIYVASITLNETELTLKIDSVHTLVATVLPEDATDKSVTWSSSDEKIATVNENGMVTAIAIGTATITVTTIDGNHTATCEVTVKEKTSGIENIVFIQNIYPNPFREKLHIIVTKNITMYMYDTNGRIVMTQELVTGDNTIHAGTLPTGMYMIRCGNNIHKVIKQ